MWLTLFFIPAITFATKLAVYVDSGVGPSGQTIAGVLRDAGVNATNVSHSDILGGCLSDYDVIMFPGGSGNGENTSLTPDGSNIVREFIWNGGGYIGICAGGFEAIQHLKIIKANVRQPYDRGAGNLTVEFNEQGTRALGYSGNETIYYHWGPVVDPPADSGNFTALSYYRTETHTRHPNKTTGQQINTPAMFTSLYGTGRVLISGPHPELTTPIIYKLLFNYVEFAAGHVKL